MLDIHYADCTISSINQNLAMRSTCGKPSRTALFNMVAISHMGLWSLSANRSMMFYKMHAGIGRLGTKQQQKKAKYFNNYILVIC